MKNRFFRWLDNSFRKIDRDLIRRTNNIQHIPDFDNRRGGKTSYAEWAHVIGIFQTLIYQTLEKKTGNHILDIGCGTGLLGISSQPFITEGGGYTGIDVMLKDIEFCKEHYEAQAGYSFIHLDVSNPTYAKTQSAVLRQWPIADESQDLVTALSVWTHLNETDAVFYFKEINRVLKSDGKAIITFFLLNDEYEESLKKRSNALGRFHSTNQNEWIFDIPAYNSENWRTTVHAKNPEDVIGVAPKGIEQLLKASGLKLTRYYPGNWKEMPGIFFQDILILEK